MAFLANNPAATQALSQVAGNVGASMLAQPSGWAPTPPDRAGNLMGALGAGLIGSQDSIQQLGDMLRVGRAAPDASLGGGPPDLTQPGVGAAVGRLAGGNPLGALFGGGGTGTRLSGAPGGPESGMGLLRQLFGWADGPGPSIPSRKQRNPG